METLKLQIKQIPQRGFLGLWICCSTRKELSHDTKLPLYHFFQAKKISTALLYVVCYLLLIKIDSYKHCYETVFQC